MSSSIQSRSIKIADTQIPETIEQLQNNQNIERFNVKVDKKSGVVRYDAHYVDGRTTTKTVLGPGLESVTRYDPTGNTTNDRNSNILTLLSKGLSQTEVAATLGVSQSLVSKVKNAKPTL